MYKGRNNLKKIFCIEAILLLIITAFLPLSQSDFILPTNGGGMVHSDPQMSENIWLPPPTSNVGIVWYRHDLGGELTGTYGNGIAGNEKIAACTFDNLLGKDNLILYDYYGNHIWSSGPKYLLNGSLNPTGLKFIAASSTPAIDKLDRVIACDNYKIILVNATDHNKPLNWSNTTTLLGFIPISPSIVENNTIVLPTNGPLLAYNATTGVKIDKITIGQTGTNESYYGIPDMLESDLNSIISNPSNCPYHYNNQNNVIEWVSNIPYGIMPSNYIFQEGNIMFVNLPDGNVSAYDETTGDELASNSVAEPQLLTDLGHYITTNSACVSGNRVFLACQKRNHAGRLYAYDVYPDHLEEAWNYTYSQNSQHSQATPTIIGDTIYFDGYNGNSFSLNKDCHIYAVYITNGTEKWNRSLSDYNMTDNMTWFTFTKDPRGGFWYEDCFPFGRINKTGGNKLVRFSEDNGSFIEEIDMKTILNDTGENKDLPVLPCSNMVICGTPANPIMLVSANHPWFNEGKWVIAIDLEDDNRLLWKVPLNSTLRSHFNYAGGDFTILTENGHSRILFPTYIGGVIAIGEYSNCWFHSINYQLKDSPEDINTLNDAVQVSYTIHTSLPDRILVKATLISQDHPILCRYITEKYYNVSSPTTVTDSLEVKLPRWAPEGQYRLKVMLYNSSGMIGMTDQEILSIIDDLGFEMYKTNDTYEPSAPFYLYPPDDLPGSLNTPQGDTQVLTNKSHTYRFSTTDPNGDSLYYQWRYEKRIGQMNCIRLTSWCGPHPSDEDCTIDLSWPLPGTYNISVRAKDSILNPNVITDWSPPLQVTVTKSTDNSPWSSDMVTTFTSTLVAVAQPTTCNGLTASLSNTPFGALNWTWDFGDSTTSYGETVDHMYTEEGNYTVNLTVKNSLGETANFTTTIHVFILNADFNLSGDAQPGKSVFLTDTSHGVYQLVNWTWEFGDDNTSYTQNTSHIYNESGKYNITLTVRDTQNNTHTCTKHVFIESRAPEFISVLDAPDPVGFGSTVTINADFYDNQSGVTSVMVNITYPDNATGNYSMTQYVDSEHDYLYLFNDTWQNGVYNYSIWVVDYANNTNYTSGFNFTVSANATLSICTLKNTYTANETINLTDPPQPPSITLDPWQVIDRGDTWNHYYNPQNNTYRVTSSTTPINYKNTTTNTYQPINTTIQPLVKTINDAQYSYGVTKGLYNFYLKGTLNITDSDPAIVIQKDNYLLTQTPPDTLMVSTDQQPTAATIGTRATSPLTQTGNTATYGHMYQLPGTTKNYAQLSYAYYPTLLKSNLILTDQKTVQEQYRLLATDLKTENLWIPYQTQLTAIDQTGNQSLGIQINTTLVRPYGKPTMVDLWTNDSIWFTDQNNTPVFGIPPLYAVDASGNMTRLIVHLSCDTTNETMLVIIMVPLPWLADPNRVYPVFVDPSVNIYAETSDGRASQGGSTNWDSVHDGSGSGSDSTSQYAYGISASRSETSVYSISRSFFRFNTSAIPDSATLLNASVFLYDKLTSPPPPYPEPQTTGVVFQKWTGGGTVSDGDYNDFTGGIYGSLGNWTIHSYNELAWVNTLTDIDVDGYTDICVREWAHDFNDSAPENETSYSNYIAYAEASIGKPYINITYSVPLPTVDAKTPVNVSTGVSPYPTVTCQVYVNDTDGGPLTVTWATNTSGNWTNIHTNGSIAANSTISYQYTSFNAYNTTYYWRVYVNDGLSNVSETYRFTTLTINTRVDPISSYTQYNLTSTLTASSLELVPDNVTLYYRWSVDNSSWDGGPWAWHNNSVDTNTSNVDGTVDVGSETSFSSAQEIAPDTNSMCLQETTDPVMHDAVDSNTSNVDSSADTGVELNFVNTQETVPDSDVMTLQEIDYGSQDVKTGVVQISNVDSISDFGTETNFVNCKETAPDSDVMTLQEADRGYSEVSEYKYVDGFTATSSQWTKTGSSPYLSATGDSKYITCTMNGYDDRWYSFADTSNTGGGYSVSLGVYTTYTLFGGDQLNWYIDTTGDNTAEFSGCFTDVTGTNTWHSTAVSGLDTAAEINAARVWFEYVLVDGFSMKIDCARLNIYREGNIDYECDFEFQWTSASSALENEQVCFYLTGSVGETLNVYYRNGAAWSSLGSITGAGWMNLTATGLTSSTYTIRVLDADQNNETTQHSWTIDCLFLHCWNNTKFQVNQEYQWTDAPHTQTSRYVCIYIANHTGSETLNLNYWNGASWNSLGSITGTGWKNFTATGLTGSTYTIQLVGASETSDASQDTWTIDAMKIYAYNATNYRGDHEYQWTTANYSETSETLCVYIANHTGSETLTVKYWSGASWVALGNITGTGWKNFTATGLTSSTYTIQLVGALETGDTSMDTWLVDCIFLRTYNVTNGPLGRDWMIWPNTSSNPDTDGEPWCWVFNYPNDTGYYEFYSKGQKTGYGSEIAPSGADSRCYHHYIPYPQFNDPFPSNGTTNVSLTPLVLINVSNTANNTMTVTWYNKVNGSWFVFGVNTSVNSSSICSQWYLNASVNGAWWSWKVNATDGVNWSESPVYMFYTGCQSKLTNLGTTNLSGYLLIQLQYYNTSKTEWVDDFDAVYEYCVLNSSETLGLDTVFNGLVNSDDLSYGDGTYRVYAALLDSYGEVLVCDGGMRLETTYEFEVEDQ